MTPLLRIALCLPLLTGCSVLYDNLGGAFEGEPEQLTRGLSPGAGALLAAAGDGIDPAWRADMHVHLISNDVNPRWLSWMHLTKRLRTGMYMSGAGVTLGPRTPAEYNERLVRLIRGVPGAGRYWIYAFDRAYDLSGQVDAGRTPFYVSNAAMFAVYEAHPDLFVPVISVNPYRTDAEAELRRWAARGCRFVKWHPPVWDVDPSHPRSIEIYKVMAELGIVLMSHTGRSRGLDASAQGMANPLLLRTPLDHGVTVIALHSAGAGDCVDLDSPDRGAVPCHQLMMRLLDEKRYEGLLFAEISAITFEGVPLDALRDLLNRPDLHHRLVDGSDYPIPGMRVAIPLHRFVKAGLLTKPQHDQLLEIYNFNPLLYDFALKRTLRDPQTNARLADTVFMTPRPLRRLLHPQPVEQRKAD